ncbi:MAG: hypothetical protein M1544_03825 [Candidatus Marsarchaeota archaeon]|nr:hypothetical protein [Candidatus Marsarchaeota archaeon]MCL5102456.1 hypothetical protein [Candidatus Marsarchaeota archaeon]
MKIGLGFLNKKPKYSGEITGISLYWKNSMHGLPGRKLDSQEFELKIPFSNKNYEELSFLKKQDNTETITNIEVREPFKLISVNPNPPVSVKSGESMEFILRIKAPDYNYSGPMVVKFVQKPAEMVHIELPEIIAVNGAKRVKVNEHGEVKSLEKGSNFEVSMQMYRVFTYNDTVKSVRVNKPFEFFGSDPKLPFTIDDKSSYVASFYIKAPDFDYAGNLELTFEK